MATFDELSRLHTRFDHAALGHLKRLVASWGMLSDLCFADLLLFAPVANAGASGNKFIVLGQVRPTTSQTLYRDVIARTHKPELISSLAAILHSEELFAEADAGFAKEMKLYPEAAIGHYIEHLLRRGGDRKTILELAERNYALRPNAESKALLERAKRNAGVNAG